MLLVMTELELLEESKLMGLFKYIYAFGTNSDDIVTADPWTPWPMP